MMGSKQELELPPGFRFHPTDEELVMHYLCRKCASLPISVPIIAEIDLYKYNPWDLPDMALYGEKEWYFFSPRDRKYPNGSRPNRAAGCGYWKATGADKPIGHPKAVAIKKALVFYAGKAPKGDKTNWIMHEYRLANVDRSARKSANAKHRTSSLRLDDWVLCRIYNKKGSFEKQNEGKKLDMLAANSEQAISHSHTCNMDATSNSVQPPQLHTDSTTSCSERYEHVMTPEVESEHKVKELDFDKALGFPTFGYLDAPTNFDNLFTPQLQFPACGNQMSPLQDIFMFLQKPL